MANYLGEIQIICLENQCKSNMVLKKPFHGRKVIDVSESKAHGI